MESGMADSGQKAEAAKIAARIMTGEVGFTPASLVGKWPEEPVLVVSGEDAEDCMRRKAIRRDLMERGRRKQRRWWWLWRLPREERRDRGGEDLT